LKLVFIFFSKRSGIFTQKLTNCRIGTLVTPAATCPLHTATDSLMGEVEVGAEIGIPNGLGT
jgi:hypothetical protein